MCTQYIELYNYRVEMLCREEWKKIHKSRCVVVVAPHRRTFMAVSSAISKILLQSKVPEYLWKCDISVGTGVTVAPQPVPLKKSVHKSIKQFHKRS